MIIEPVVSSLCQAGLRADISRWSEPEPESGDTWGPEPEDRGSQSVPVSAGEWAESGADSEQTLHSDTTTTWTYGVLKVLNLFGQNLLGVGKFELCIPTESCKLSSGLSAL